MIVIGNLVWYGRGSVWAVFRVPAPTPARTSDFEGVGAAALLSALGRLGCEARLSSFGVSLPPHEAGCLLLSIEVWAQGMRGAFQAVGAAQGAALRPFGLGGSLPAPRLAAVRRATADRLVAGLAAFRLAEPSGAEVRSALDDGGYGWREVRCCGHAAAVVDGRPRYRACFVGLPIGVARIEWPLHVPGPPAAWSICVQPSRGGASAALLVRIQAGDLVELGERAAALRRAARERGWDLIRPGSGQALLGAAMVPGPAHRRLPRSLFFPLPHALTDPAPALLPVS